MAVADSMWDEILGPRPLQVLDLFSGIGGFSLGLGRAGFQTVAFCEIEKYPQQVLKKHWPEVPIYEDVRKLTREQLTRDGIGTIDVVCGGFPCQPFSQAGKRGGTEDDRHLWPEMFRVIQEVRPRWVIGENVAGLGSIFQYGDVSEMESKEYSTQEEARAGFKGILEREGGGVLEMVLGNLESAGYSVQTFLIPACAINAPHRRDRIWIIAHADKQGQPDGSINEGEGCGELGVVGHARLFGQEEHEKQTTGIKQPSEAGVVSRNTESDAGDQVGEVRQGQNTDPGGVCEDVADSQHLGGQERHPERTEQDRQRETGDAVPCGEAMAHSRSHAEGSAHRSGIGRDADQEQNHRDEVRHDAGNRSEDMAHTAVGPEGGLPERKEKEHPRPSRSGKDVAYGKRTGLEGLTGDGAGGEEPGWIRQEKDGSVGPGGLCEPRRSDRGAAQPGMGDMVDGISPWLVEPDIPRIAKGVKNRVNMLKALGNAVVPQIPELIGRTIMDIEKGLMEGCYE